MDLALQIADPDTRPCNRANPTCLSLLIVGKQGAVWSWLCLQIGEGAHCPRQSALEVVIEQACQSPLWCVQWPSLCPFSCVGHSCHTSVGLSLLTLQITYICGTLSQPEGWAGEEGFPFPVWCLLPTFAVRLGLWLWPQNTSGSSLWGRLEQWPVWGCSVGSHFIQLSSPASWVLDVPERVAARWGPARGSHRAIQS